MTFLRAFFCWLMASLLSCQVNAEEVLIAVASNFTGAMNALVQEFEKDSGHRIKVAFGSSGKFYAQIKQGAPFDVFFSADQTTAEALERDKLIVPGSRFTYAVGVLVLWTNTVASTAADERLLTQAHFRKLALANPKLAPYGAAAMEVLESLGLTAATRAKWVMGENIAQTYQFVRSGNADIGFVALAQIVDKKHQGKGSVWVIPPQLYRPIQQDAVLLRRAQHNPAARDLIAFMHSEAAKKIIAGYGYHLPLMTQAK